MFPFPFHSTSWRPSLRDGKLPGHLTLTPVKYKVLISSYHVSVPFHHSPVIVQFLSCMVHSIPGQPVDGPQNGPAPGPWDISAHPGEMFKDHMRTFEVPHTASVKVCHGCMGVGMNTCRRCLGCGQVCQSWDTSCDSACSCVRCCHLVTKIVKDVDLFLFWVV